MRLERDGINRVSGVHLVEAQWIQAGFKIGKQQRFVDLSILWSTTDITLAYRSDLGTTCHIARIAIREILVRRYCGERIE